MVSYNDYFASDNLDSMSNSEGYHSESHSENELNNVTMNVDDAKIDEANAGEGRHKYYIWNLSTSSTTDFVVARIYR